MTLTLDLRTLCIVTSCICLSYGIGLALFNRAHIKHHNLMTFVLALMLVGSSTGLIALRGLLPDFVSIVIANVMISAGFSCFLHGYSKFRKIHNRFAQISLSLLIPLALSFVYFTYVAPSLSTRIVVVAAFMSLTLYMTAYNVRKGLASDSPVPVNIIAASFSIIGTIELIRAIYFSIWPEDQYFNASDASLFVLQMSYLFGTLNIAITTFGLVWLINERLISSLQEMSFKDNLTGFFNRHGLEQQLPQLVHTSQESQQPLSALMLDIDHFKLINDTYGHLEGDNILKRCAEEIQSLLPTEHLAFRYGGEEFLVILKSCNLSQAQKLAETIRQTIEAKQLAMLSGRSLTLSIGLTDLHPEDHIDNLIKRADQALYLAKSQGRNQVVANAM
ncbi:amino acid transporter [Vibrio vulnificus]|nr:amino acid transporter [Vibrio vulnificus]OQK56452.1 amino acid transporter [Vibrio vulnificus]OQK65191.1 amino acid transporter [Vibrio vulnificus]OQK67063.1 amino acid transporter [Vibrio vulnificus]POC18774.1 GGDEF domain-containing protein [Vibrio vulnificus]